VLCRFAQPIRAAYDETIKQERSGKKSEDLSSGTLVNGRQAPH
jgi:hypothetical protein